MLEIKDSDLFKQYINHDNVVLAKINYILTGSCPGFAILNDQLMDDIIRKIVNVRREKTVSDMANAVKKGNIILFTVDPQYRLPDMLPFFVTRNKATNKRFVYVNMYPMVSPLKDPEGRVTYEMNDAGKAYTTLYSAYLALEKFDAKYVLSPAMAYEGALLWADMFNKPLYDSFGMHNPERNSALMYLAMKFFLSYIVQANPEQTQQITSRYIRETMGKKNDMLLFMEEQIETLQLKPFDGLVPYLTTILNNEVTQTKGIRVANIQNSMNVPFYLQKFTGVYGSSALMALCTFPYFVYVMVCAMGKSRLVKDKSFDRIFNAHTKEANSFIIHLGKEL